MTISIVKTITFGYALFSIFSVWSLFLCFDFKNNTWPRLKSAWATVQQRREVSKIVNSLATVTADEIATLGVCQEDLLTDSGIMRIEK